MDEAAAHPGGSAGVPIFQVHPSLRCNLSCAHCYSDSSPKQRDQLDADLIAGAIGDAAEVGFGILSVSGGEPLLYPHLRTLLEAGRAAGMRTQLVTNGWFLPTRRYLDVADLIDVLAISVDGPAARHNRMRGSGRAFAELESGLNFIRERAVPFGIIHTVGPDNWHELFEVAAFAAAAGAALFQIHMLEAAGRAADTVIDDGTAERVVVLGALLKAQYAGRMHVHADLQHSSLIGQLCAGDVPAEALSIMVLEADGTIVPLTYGFDRRYAIGNIRQQRLRDSWRPYLAGDFQRFLELRGVVHHRLTAGGQRAIFNWHESMAAAAAA